MGIAVTNAIDCLEWVPSCCVECVFLVFLMTFKQLVFLSDSEKRCLRAAAAVQSQLRCPVMIHPGRNEEAPFEIIRIYQEAGGDVRKLVMGHLDSK